MKNLPKIKIKPLVMLLFTAVILTANMITTSNLISENVTKSIMSDTLRGNMIETFQDPEESSLSDVQTPYNVSKSDITELSSNRNKLQLSNEKSEVLLEDDSIITSLESIYDQLDISILDQDINKLVKVIDSKLEVIVGFHPAHSVSYGNYGYHLHKSKAQLEKELPKLNAIVLEVPISSLKTFMSYWQALEIVRYVEVAQVTSVSAVVNDLNWSLQYGPQIIQANLAWDIQIGNPESILVAVIDTGVDYNHPDLVDQYVPGGYDYVNDDNDPMDDHSHGTHCAGVIGATINNSIGIAGIANVSIMAIKVFDSGGFGNDYDAASAIINATDAGADVLSNSYGFPSSSTALEDAVSYASANDVVIVVAAGNDGSPVSSYPALYPETIVVSATDDSDAPASFTNYGSAVDVAAPGVNIWSTIPISMGSYGYMSGTSMACPHAAAVCALIRAEFPDFSAEEVRQHLNTSVDDLGQVGWDDYYGYGRINAFRAVQLPPEHELITYLIGAPTAMLPNETVVLKAVVYNDGQNTEVDIDLQLWIENIKVDNQIFTSLAVRENGTIEYSWTPKVLGVYNITVYAVPVISELFSYNNKITKMVDVTWPIINYNLGDFIEILWADNTLFANFTYISDIDPTHVQVDFGDGSNWQSVNTLTRLVEDGNIWVGTYYLGQIETDINLGETIKWHSTTGTVESTVYYDWNGMILEAWNISIASGSAYAYYHKETGIWLYYEEWTGAEFFMNNSNMINWQQSEHEVQVILETPVLLATGESTVLNASVHNRGTSEETNVILQLWIEDSLEYYETFTSLPSGAIENISYSWIPTENGNYNITAYVIPVPEELYVVNNAKTKMVIVSISTLLSDFEGSLSDWTWDGLWQPINDSQTYGEVYSPIHSMYYGQNDTGNYDNGSANNGTLMTPWYALGLDVISLSFWSWYETEESGHFWDLKDVYLITTEEIWIPIGYVSGDMNTWVQFFFDISSYAGQVVRFAFVFDSIDDISNNYRGWYVDDVIILGTVNAPIVTVTYPNGGEVLSGTITITWDASDLDGDPLTYSVYYWDASAWIELISGWTTTSYEWDTTLVSDGEFYQVRIVANDSALTGEDESDGSFTIDNPDAPIVTVTYPNGGEALSGTVTITWDASDLDGDSLTYSVYYWDASAWIELISGWTTTSYEWDTTLVSDGEFYQVRIVANDSALTGEDESDGSFTIDNPDAPIVTVTYPNGGEVLSNTVTITWDASDLDGDSLTYSVYYWDASAWIELISGWTTTSYEWDTTLVSNGEFYQVRIVANDSALTGKDESDGSFTIDNPNAPIVTVTYPNGGETLSGTVTITWDASDPDGDSLTYTIYYWDSGVWIELVSGWSATSYEWDTTAVSDGEFYQVRIKASDGALTDEDESDESFTVDNEPNSTTTITTSITTTTTSTKTPSGFEVTLVMLILLFGGLTIILIRKKRS